MINLTIKIFGNSYPVGTLKMVQIATGLSSDQIKALRHRRRITTYKLPGVLLYDMDEAEKYAANHKVQK